MTRIGTITPGTRLKAIGIALSAIAFIVAPAVRGDDSPSTQNATTAPSEASKIDRLEKRLDAQDAEIHDLKARLAARDAPTTQEAEIQKHLEAQDSKIAGVEEKMNDTETELNKAASQETYPTLQFHGFGDIDYHVSNRKLDKNAFTLGEFDVFLTSQISPDLGVLSETVLSADETNDYGIEIERLLLQYHPSEYFNLDLGRYHTAVGYYNTAYHHGTWFQTATGRPLPLNFEDSGGVIPVHSVGLSIHGAIPSPGLGLGYFVEVGNGRQYQSPTAEDNQVGNVFDDNDYKAVNVGFISRPEAIPGLQVGAGIYHDTLTPRGVPETDEIMVHGHIVYKNANWEFLSEAYAIRHDPRGGGEPWSSIYFAQIARKFGKWTPYARFTSFDGADSDPIYQLIEQTGRHYGPAVGIRYDFSTFLALKLQYDYVVNHGPSTDLGPTFNPIGPGSYSELTMQASFTY